MLVHPTHLVLFSITLSNNEIFVDHFDQIIPCFCFCAFHTSKMNFILQPQEQKSCRRQKQYFSALCGCMCTWPIWCCPVQPIQMKYCFVHFFWSKIVWSKTHTFHCLNIPQGKLEHRIDSLSWHWHITCERKASLSQPTIIFDATVVYPCFPKLLIVIKSNLGP